MTTPPPPHGPSEAQAAWGLPSRGEHRWPTTAAVAIAIYLQLVLPNKVIVGLGGRYLLPALEAGLGVALIALNPGRITKEEQHIRAIGLTLIALVNVANIVSLGELVNFLISPRAQTTYTEARQLIFASVPIWLTNVIVFALWYWALDRGGPAARASARHPRPDFLFPQMSTPACATWWTPKFYDYLYTSFTNATAFSPTDTMPLTGWAKLLMAVQSVASLLTVALVISRAVNIL